MYDITIKKIGRKWVEVAVDGDNWGVNTIRTGGAGAYGWYAPLSAVASELNDYEKLVD